MHMISVIVPIFNTEKYLKRCLESILGQDYSKLEVLLIDDGSTDNSKIICKEYEAKDNRVRYIPKANEGQASARNLALELCTGDWVSFVDSDDWIEPGMYSEMMGVIKESNVDLVICGWYRNHGFKQIEQRKENTKRFYNNEELMEAYLTTPNITSSMCNKLYRKELWKEMRFPEIRAREDAATIYRIIANVNSAVHIGKSYYVQYVRPGSTERSKFNEKKLVTIEISKAEKVFVSQRYPKFEHILSCRLVDCYSNLMSEIVSTFSYRRNIGIYQDLMEQFVEEINRLMGSNYRIDEFNSNTKMLYKNPTVFLLKSIIYGLKNYFVDIVKKLVFKIKNSER